MSSFMESFFDEPTPGFTLWEKKSSTFKPEQEVVVYKGQLAKLSKKNNKWKARLFVLTDKHLYYKKDEKDKKIRGIMKVGWVRTEFLLEGNPKNAVYTFGIRFIKNLKYSDLWCDENEFKMWKTAIPKVFIQSDFHTKFNAIKMIGKGSFARVYLVEDKETNEKFAVKAFSKEYLLSQSKGKESLVNEIEVMKDLVHENIMNLNEIHESKNSIYLVLELLEGGELFNYIADKGGLSAKDYYRVIKCILKALTYMATKGIMHRDLKPENMILKNKVDKLENGVLKLVDFGLATKFDIPEYLFKRCGTPGFVAPEVINAPSNENIHYDPKCDVFSAGIIFYILIIGSSPFDGKSFQEILTQNKQCKIDFNHPKLKRIPQCLDLLKKMLETDPKKRYTAAECLKHPFFADQATFTELPDTIEKGDYSKFNADYKNIKPNKGVDYSFEMREGVVNGKLDTVKDSYDFNNKGKSNNNKNIKRESIFKQVAGNSDDNNKMLDQFKNMNFDSKNNSDCSSDESEDEDDSGKNKKINPAKTGDDRRKSKFGN